MGMEIEKAVTELKRFIREDGVFDHGDLLRLRALPEAQADPHVVPQAVNVVLDEMFRGVFQIPACFKIAPEVQDELSQLGTGLQKDLATKAQKYMAAGTCLTEPFDRAVVEAAAGEVREILGQHQQIAGQYSAKIEEWKATGFSEDDPLRLAVLKKWSGAYGAVSQRLQALHSRIENLLVLAGAAFDPDSSSRLERLAQALKAEKILPSYDAFIEAKGATKRARKESRVISLLHELDQSATELIPGGMRFTAKAPLELFHELPGAERKVKGALYHEGTVIFIDRFPTDRIESFLNSYPGMSRVIEDDRFLPRLHGWSCMSEPVMGGYEEVGCVRFWVRPLSETRTAVIYRASAALGGWGMWPIPERVAYKLWHGLEEVQEAAALDDVGRHVLAARLAELDVEEKEATEKHEFHQLPAGILLAIGAVTSIAGFAIAGSSDRDALGIGLGVGGLLVFSVGPIYFLKIARPDFEGIAGERERIKRIQKWDEMLQQRRLSSAAGAAPQFAVRVEF